ncbi:hypothetical protein [Mucilaginibacter sp. 22184]|uniref:hypothetical protein n=1 Tax=Mucilaginibacter sp. 22184 TaxID=3453887 RepID=UPI003F83DB7C
MERLKEFRFQYARGIRINSLVQLLIVALVILLIFPVDSNFQVAGEIRLILVVCLSGVLGSSLRYTGILIDNKNKGKLPLYLDELFMRLLNGIPTAAGIYLLLRGMILSTSANYEVFNVYGLALICIIMGYFSYEASKKVTGLLQAILERDQVIEDKIDKIGNILGLETLGNYHGYFIAELTCSSLNVPQEPFGLTSENIAEPEFEYILRCWFSPHYFPLYGGSNETRKSSFPEIDITGGKDVAIVTFSAAPRLNGLKFTPTVLNFEVSHDRDSIVQEFRLKQKSNSLADCWIEISQMNRLISVVSPIRYDNFTTGRDGQN